MGENRELAAAMAELNISQAELARRVNAETQRLTGREGSLTDRDIRRYLSGETTWPQHRQRLGLERVLGRPATELGFSPRSSRARQGHAEDRVHRRTFLAAATGSPVAALAPAPRPRLGQRDADRFHEQYLGLLRVDSRLGGGQRTEVSAVELATRIQSSLAGGGASDRIRRQLHRLASDVMCLAAFAAIDASAPQRARSHLDQALTLASLARDGEAMYRVWDQLMLTFSQRENHAEAAASAEVMKRSSLARREPLYASLGHLRHANALARLHQGAESLRALNLAEKAFGQAGVEQPSGWIAFYGRAEFDALSSYVWTALGEHERAEFCLHRTLAAIPADMVRDTALYTAHLSLSQARQGELELACDTGRRAYGMLLPSSGSQRTTNTLARTRHVIEATGTKASEVTSWIEESRRWT
ncbi:XRE family transcriptional regulator [Streptomyces sp. B93]|uniref:XRE family transcriptional regulator n=1 Tax=Streptomyces sp. B93 TaxID=2824875 RepID=UPI0027E5732B|nr:XRE family transcriptional regulator [Streptomyces sp. B93]